MGQTDDEGARIQPPRLIRADYLAATIMRAGRAKKSPAT